MYLVRGVYLVLGGVLSPGGVCGPGGCPPPRHFFDFLGDFFGDPPPGKLTQAYGQRAAGTHPTGMHSCCLDCLSPQQNRGQVNRINLVVQNVSTLITRRLVSSEH